MTASQTPRPAARGRARRLAAVTGVAALSLAGPLSVAASAATHRTSGTAIVHRSTRGSVGMVLVTAGGATLYHFTPDKPNKVTCTGSCATLWPPLLVPAGTKAALAARGISGVGTTKVAGGRLQLTYHRMPLYRYAPDSGTSTSGQGVGGVWFVVHPGAAHSSVGAATTTTVKSGGY